MVVQLNLLLKLLFTSFSCYFLFLSQLSVLCTCNINLARSDFPYDFVPLTFHVVYPRDTLTVGDKVQEQDDSDDDDDDEDCGDAAGEPEAKRIRPDRSDSGISVERGEKQGHSNESNSFMC